MIAATFDHIELYRPELKAHCYRMLGSPFDAEDAVQETFLRAWRSSEKFEGRTTLRGWLYRIATNVCLTMLSRGKTKRLTPYLSSPAATDFPRGPSREVSWLEPYPQTFLTEVPDTASAPHARYEQKEATELAFVAAIAYLPPKQRAALLLHDVLGWSAQEAARALETSTASINSALQRARETLRKKLPEDYTAARRPATTQAQSDLLAQYVKAWDSHDMRALVKLLKDDAILSMPPIPPCRPMPTMNPRCSSTDKNTVRRTGSHMQSTCSKSGMARLPHCITSWIAGCLGSGAMLRPDSVEVSVH
jgi:RNA polymerase sigma-70 factor (ECF subfamily)